MRLSIAVLAAVFLIGCRGASSPAPNANETRPLLCLEPLLRPER